MSGRYPIRLGLQGPVLNGGNDWGLPENETTIADKLSRAGYRTHMVGKWHLGMYSRAVTPTARGFDSSYGYLLGMEDYYNHTIGTGPGSSTTFYDLLEANNDTGVFREDTKQRGVYSTPLFTQKAIDVVRAHKSDHGDKPLFLYFPLQNVHSPLEAPEEYKQRAPCATIVNNNRKTFCAMALIADEAIGNLTQVLRTELGSNLLIVIAGDNGGMPGAAGNNFPLRGHKAELFEGGIRNNAVVYSPSPALLPAALRGTTYAGGLVHVTDLHAGFAKLGGAGAAAIAAAPGFALDGLEGVLGAVLSNATSPRTEFLVNIYDGDTMGPAGAAYVQWPWKLYLGVANATWTPVPTTAADDDETEEAGAGAGAAPELSYVPWIGSSVDMRHPVDRAIARRAPGASTLSLLFNLETDPTEHADVYSRHPDVVAAITAKIDALRAQAMPACSGGGTGAGAGKGCDYSDPAALAAATKSGTWLPWMV